MLLRTVAGETLLIPVEESVKEFNGIFTLSPTAALIFQTVSEGGEAADAAAALCEQFDVTPEQAQADVRDFLDALAQYGIL